MKILPFTPLPIQHPARAWTPSEEINIKRMFAEFIEQHAPILVCPVDRNRIGDDYDDVERGAYLETAGAFKP